MQRLISLVLLVPAWAIAHEGHGIEGASHYHATDVWGFLALVGVIAVMWWMGRNK